MSKLWKRKNKNLTYEKVKHTWAKIIYKQSTFLNKHRANKCSGKIYWKKLEEFGFEVKLKLSWS